MTRPHIEAAALLAAHGHAAAATLALRRTTRSLRMPAADYAFATRLDDTVRPHVFADVHALARHIERRRNLQAVELVEVEDMEIAGRPGLHDGVQVFTLLPDGGRDACLGWAWLDGAGRDRLEPALRQARRDAMRKDAA